MAHWRFNKGDEVPDELFETWCCRATFACDVVIYDDEHGFRKLIGSTQPLLNIECIPPQAHGYFNARKPTMFCVDYETPKPN